MNTEERYIKNDSGHKEKKWSFFVRISSQYCVHCSLVRITRSDKILVKYIQKKWCIMWKNIDTTTKN